MIARSRDGNGARTGRGPSGRTEFLVSVVVTVAVLFVSIGCSQPESGVSAGSAAFAGPGDDGGDVAPAASAPLPDSWSLGRSATGAEVAALDIDIMPDGRGLPPGSGDHAAGADVYLANCAACHGMSGEGTPTAGPLVGADPESGFRARTVGHYWPYSTTAFDYIRRAMPWDRPGTLSNDEVYAVVAWILAENGVIERDAVMDATTLAAVEMPSRDRFVPDDRPGGSVVR